MDDSIITSANKERDEFNDKTSALDVTQKVTVAILMAALFYFGPRWLFTPLSSLSFRLWESAFNKEVVSSLFLLLIVIIMMLLFRVIMTKANFFQKVKLENILIIPLYGIILMILWMVWNNLNPVNKGSSYYPYDNFRMFHLVILSFSFAPILQELAFRGVIQTYLGSLSKYRFKILRITLSLPVLLSALLFSLIHLNSFTQYTVMGISGTLLVTFSIGIFLGFQFEKTRNIFIPILGHYSIVLTTTFFGPLFGAFFGNTLSAENIYLGLVYGGSLYGGLLFHTF